MSKRSDQLSVEHSSVSVWVHRPDVHSTVVDGEAVIVDLDEDAYFTLNQTGTIVWNVVGRAAPIVEAVDAIFDRFDISRDQAQTDVRGLLNSLTEAGLIRPKQGEA